ncbi:Lipid A biosynthesis lauroyl acyltransferase [Phycisphaerae bacterium RAS1]|nr:Lipid A biosynthesis lauroyl acyltransferase [Phycisphaerae bacterium RAS1]
MAWLVSPRSWFLRWTEAPTVRLGLRYLLEYAAMRLWTWVIHWFPIDWNLVTGRWMGRMWWRLHRNSRVRSMENLRASLGEGFDDSQRERIARRCLEHFAQVYLVELPMMPRLITEWTWARYVELDELGPALRELLGDRPVILVTPHFGNFELLGYTISRLGLPISALMRPLDNAMLTNYLTASREAGGLTLLFKKGAMAQAPKVLENNGALAFIADQDAGRKGYFVDFFGRKASTYKSIALLAIQYRAAVIVGYAVRTRTGFHYRIGVERIIQPDEWAGRPDEALWITQAFSTAMEASIRRHPEQYLWMHRRWKHRPKEEAG